MDHHLPTYTRMRTCQKYLKNSMYRNCCPNIISASVSRAYCENACVMNCVAGSTHNRMSATLNTKLFMSVFPGSMGWTLMRKNRVPNLKLPFATASSRYSPKMATDSVPKSGNHPSNHVKYVFRKGCSCREGVVRGREMTGR